MEGGLRYSWRSSPYSCQDFFLFFGLCALTKLKIQVCMKGEGGGFGLDFVMGKCVDGLHQTPLSNFPMPKLLVLLLLLF